MECNRFRSLLMRCGMCILFLTFSMVPLAIADDSAAIISDNARNEKQSNSQSTAFDDFPEFDDFEDARVAEVFDPLRGYNRFMTGVNDHIYLWIWRPAALGYRFVVAEPVRLAIDRLFTNGLYPVRFVNNLLQLKFKRAGIETTRFCVNTTLGFAGLFDPAKRCMGLDAFPEDFGQTLGYYGAGSGFHIVIPVMGPSNLRDMLGLIPDTFLRPLTYVGDVRATVGVTVAGYFNKLSLYVDVYDELRVEAIDLYIFQRDAYEMRRQKAIEE